MAKRPAIDYFALATATSMYLGVLAFTRWDWLVGWLSKDGASGWVQAVGSLLSVWAAIAVMAGQVRAAKELEREKRISDRIERFNGAIAPLNMMWMHLIMLRGLNGQGIPLADKLYALRAMEAQDDYARILRSAEVLRSLPVWEFGRAALSIQMAREQVEQAVAGLRELQAAVANEHSPINVEGVTTRLTRLTDIGTSISRSIQEIRVLAESS